MARHLEAGRRSEQLARRYLERHGLHLVTANYRCRYGEIDLIMRDGRTLVIVEVRYRRATRVMLPAHSVTPEKMRRIARTAADFLARHRRWRFAPVRFDVVGIHGNLTCPAMNWLRGAFTMDDLPGEA